MQAADFFSLRLKRLFLLPPVIVVLLLGCSPWYSGWKYNETVTRVLSGGVVTDTTAVLRMRTYDFWTNEGPGGGSEDRNLRDYLALVDIRFEKIYWEKELELNGSIYSWSFDFFDFTDSILIFTEIDYKDYYYSNNSYSISKVATIAIDEQFDKSSKIVVPKGKDLELRGEGWFNSSKITVRPWKDGLILANNKYETSIDNNGNYIDENPDDHYALIDTISGTFERWTPSGEFEWMNECEDVKWSSEGGLCLSEEIFYLIGSIFYEKKERLNEKSK